jgi:Ser/Thr protein kinase RdoA (MazF antagonist)
MSTGGADALGTRPPGARPPARPPFPVERSLVSADAIAAAVERLHALAPPVRCRLLHPGTNDTYLVESQAVRFVARLYGARRSAGEIAYELDLLLHLERAGVEVSVPVATTDGPLVHALPAPEGPRRLVLFTHADGRPLDWRDRGESLAAGRLTGRVHAAADSFSSPRPRAPLGLEALLSEPLDVIDPLLGGRDEERRELARIASRLRARAEAVAPDLDWGVCHADVGAANMHVAGRRLTVFDFDLCAPGWRAWDLAGAWAAARLEGDEVIWGAFLRGYREARPLRAADVAVVPLFHAIGRVWSLGVRARNAPHRGSWPFEGPHLEAQLERLRRLGAEHPSPPAPIGTALA